MKLISSRIWDFRNEIMEKELEEIEKILEEDGIIIIPTDTVYGIACNCFSEKAIKRLYDLKGRDYKKPIGILTDSVEKIEKVAEITEKEREIIHTYLPGALTLVLKKKKEIPDLLTANLDTIGVRIPNHKIALEILKKVPFPLATTSANLSGEKAGIRLNEFRNIFEGKVEGMVEGGPTEIQVASTVIKVEKDEIKVIREGTIKIEE